jgi:hypothetical protein
LLWSRTALGHGSPKIRPLTMHNFLKGRKLWLYIIGDLKMPL